MKYHAIVSYIDYELKFFIFAKNAKEINLVYESLITRKNIYNLDNDGLYDSLLKKIETEVNAITKKFEDLNPNLYILVENETVTGNDTKTLRIQIPLQQKHQIRYEDLEAFDKEAYSKSKLPEGKVYGGYMIEEYYIDGKNVITPLQRTASHNIEAIGSQQFVDRIIFDTFHNLFDNTYFNIKGFVLNEYIVKKMINIQDNSGIIELTRKKTNFYVSQKRYIKTISAKIGLVNFFNNVYEKLRESFEENNAKQAVNFIKKHFIVNQYPINYYINEEVTLNDVSNLFRNVLCNYFSYFKKELASNGIKIQDYILIINNYEMKELAPLLEEKEIFIVKSFNQQLLRKNIDHKIKGQYNNLDYQATKALTLVEELSNIRYWEYK